MTTRRSFIKNSIGIAAATVTGQALALENPFGFKKMEQAYQNTQVAEGKCGEGKCGGTPKPKETEGKCGEGKCGGRPKPKETEGKCGEGKCGSS